MVLMLIGLMFPQTALSDHENQIDKVWSKGDLVTTRVLCESQDAILEVINADMKGPEPYVMMVIGTLIDDEQCVGLPYPVTFMVSKALLEYEDFSKIPSVVLGAVARDGEWIGWVLAAGTYDENKNSDEKSKQISI